jgi:hypothetical protein
MTKKNDSFLYDIDKLERMEKNMVNNRNFEDCLFFNLFMNLFIHSGFLSFEDINNYIKYISEKKKVNFQNIVIDEEIDYHQNLPNHFIYKNLLLQSKNINIQFNQTCLKTFRENINIAQHLNKSKYCENINNILLKNLQIENLILHLIDDDNIFHSIHQLKNLKKLSINAKNLCKKFKKLPCEHLTIYNTYAFLKSVYSDKLKSIELFECHDYHEQDILDLIHNCPNMTSFKMSFDVKKLNKINNIIDTLINTSHINSYGLIFRSYNRYYEKNYSVNYETILDKIFTKKLTSLQIENMVLSPHIIQSFMNSEIKSLSLNDCRINFDNKFFYNILNKNLIELNLIDIDYYFKYKDYKLNYIIENYIHLEKLSIDFNYDYRELDFLIFLPLKKLKYLNIKSYIFYKNFIHIDELKKMNCNLKIEL